MIKSQVSRFRNIKKKMLNTGIANYKNEVEKVNYTGTCQDNDMLYI